MVGIESIITFQDLINDFGCSWMNSNMKGRIYVFVNISVFNNLNLDYLSSMAGRCNVVTK
jgi:hypothetical protein